MPLAFGPPLCSDTPQPPHWPEGVSECARRYSNMRKEAILRSAVSSARICNQEKVPKFQTSAIRNSCAQMPSSRRLRHPYSYHPSDGTKLEPERRSPPMWGHSAAARKSPLAPECLVGSGGLEPPTRPLWAKLLSRTVQTNQTLNQVDEVGSRLRQRARPKRPAISAVWVYSPCCNARIQDRARASVRMSA